MEGLACCRVAKKDWLLFLAEKNKEYRPEKERPDEKGSA
jgi:hypothetical protein